MTTREDASVLVQRMQECFNTRQFGQAAWRALTARFPGMRVVAQDILVDGDKAAVRSAVEGDRGPGRRRAAHAVRDLPHRRRPARGDVGGQHGIPGHR